MRTSGSRPVRRTNLIASMATVAAVLAAAGVAYAVGVLPSNGVVGANVYHVGDTIQYAESVTNTNDGHAVMSVAFIRPDGSTVTLATDAEFAPGQVRSWDPTYVVTGAETIVGSSPNGDVIGSRLDVVGKVEVEEDYLEDVSASVGKTSIVLKPGISVATTVDFDDDDVFNDEETDYAGAATWKAVVTNTGNCPLSVDLSDLTGEDFEPFVLAAGASRTVTFGSVESEDFTNSVTATGVDDLGGAKGTVSDSDPATVKVREPEVPRVPDLAITKTASSGTADPDGLITYTLTFRNVGDGAADGYTITDDFDERYVDVADAAGGSVAGGKIVWSFDGTLGPQESGSITYTVRVKAPEVMPEGETAVANTVVIDTEEDADRSNNSAQATVLVDNPFLPFTDDDDDDPRDDGDDTRRDDSDPFLPFTGDSGLAAGAFALLSAVLGVGIRQFSRGEAS